MKSEEKARPSGRKADELRRVTITRNFTRHAEGSVLVEFGDTKVLCTASVETGVPGGDSVMLDRNHTGGGVASQNYRKDGQRLNAAWQARHLNQQLW